MSSSHAHPPNAGSVTTLDPATLEPEDPAITPFLKAMQESDQYPNLMQPDPFMDLHHGVRFKPNQHSPYPSQVIVRNEPSMFTTLQEILKSSDAEYARQVEEEQQEEQALDKANPLRFLHLSQLEINKLFQYRLATSRVTQQTGKGKVYKFSILTVVGNGDGLLGYGEGKDEEAPRATAKALIAAVRNMDHVARFEDRTVFTEMENKFGSTRVFVRPRPVGFGLHCNPNIHQVLKAAGIKDASAKVWGSRNPRRVIKALFQMLHPSHVPIAMGNGIGGPGRRLDKGYGVRTKEEVERERGRQLFALRT